MGYFPRKNIPCETAGTEIDELHPGIAVRLWQLGIEMRPILAKESLWAYPFFAGIGGSFGYWLQGVESRQLKILAERREAILEKRRRRDQREGVSKIEEAGTVAATP